MKSYLATAAQRSAAVLGQTSYVQVVKLLQASWHAHFGTPDRARQQVSEQAGVAELRANGVPGFAPPVLLGIRILVRDSLALLDMGPQIDVEVSVDRISSPQGAQGGGSAQRGGVQGGQAETDPTLVRILPHHLER